MAKTDDFVENLEQVQETVQVSRKAADGDLARVQDLAADLVDQLQSVPEGDLVGEVIENAMKLLRDQTNRGDIKLINKSLKEIRYALKIFAPYRDVRKVSIFGSARTPETHPDYIQCEQFAKRIANEGWMVITGAGGGIMAAGHGGAGAEPSFGLAIRLPFEQATNIHIAKDKKLINFKYFFTRKLMFVRSSNALALFPGGFGTMDEGFEVLTLIQTGKAVPMPIVMIEHPDGNYWKGWQRYVKDHLLKMGLISEEDLHLYKITHDIDEAVHEISHFYSNYHSVRVVRNDLAMRLQRRPTPEQLEHIQQRFGHLCISGTFRLSGPLPVEADEPALDDLTRLVFHYNRRDAGELRLLINYLNDLP